MTIVGDRPAITGGVDTHGEVHVAAALDRIGGLLGVREFLATTTGYASLLGWLGEFGDLGVVGVEGTGSYGAGLARYLTAAGVRVVEVNRPDRQDRRRQGKSDPLDAVSAARAALSGKASAAPKGGDGAVEAIRALMVAKRSARRERTEAINQARALIVTGPDELRARLAGLGPAALAAAIAALRPRPGAVPGYATRVALRELGRRVQFLDAQLVLRSSLGSKLGRAAGTSAWCVEASLVPKFLRARPPQDDSEARKIRRLAGARHAPADWIERARIVALSWDGLGVAAIAARVGCHENKVRRWLHRFNAEGIDGLGNRPGAGRRRRIAEADRPAIIALARSVPPGRLLRDGAGELPAEREDGPAEWTLDTLTEVARRAGIRVGRSQVRRILRAEKVRWRRTRSQSASTDPESALKGPRSWSSAPPRRPAPR